MSSSGLKKLLLGAWRCADGFSGVVIQFQDENGNLKVSATDEDDGEKAEIYDVNFVDGRFCFAAHWPSNGRLVKYRFLATGDGVADVTFTYSEQETWLKEKA
jgi:hypothetical protein